MADGNIQEGQVGVDGQRILVFFDRLAVITDGFKVIAIHPVDIHHIRPKLKGIADVLLGLGPFLLVDEDLGIESQRQRVLAVE